jgi:hypothetical protein
MKKYYLLILFIIAASLTGCYDREILDSKEGESIDPVSNLSFTTTEPQVVFTWNMPSGYPADIIQPVSVVVTIYKNEVKVSTITLADAPTTYTYTSYSSANTYRFIFKVKAAVDTDDPNKSTLRYSSGKVAVL